jgi:hypothetical protein
VPKKKVLFEGENFGKLTVLLTTNDGKVPCICECGKKIIVIKSNLTSGKSKSCGKGACQSHFKDLSGKKFEYITVIKLIGSDGDHGTTWECLCDCGSKFIARGASIRKGHTKSCGCKSAILISKRNSLPPGEINIRQLFANYRNGAKNRELNFVLTLEEFREFIFKNCHYCGSLPNRLNVVENIQQENLIYYNGIDRLDNTIGYQLNNCITCCKTCNYAKSSISYNDFITWINNLVKYRGSL